MGTSENSKSNSELCKNLSDEGALHGLDKRPGVYSWCCVTERLPLMSICTWISSNELKLKVVRFRLDIKKIFLIAEMGRYIDCPEIL